MKKWTTYNKEQKLTIEQSAKIVSDVFKEEIFDTRNTVSELIVENRYNKINIDYQKPSFGISINFEKE